MVVGNGIEMSIGDLDIAGTFLGEDGVALDDEGVAQLIAYIVPETGRGVAEQVAIAIVVNGVGHTQVVVHQGGHEIEMRGAVGMHRGEG